MAPQTTNTDTADQLVATLLPEGISAAKLRKYNDAFSTKLRSQSYARTTRFEVEQNFDVLQEKFQIVNNDELADAVRCRLLELRHRANKWLPDVLDLMLRLADDPTNKTKIECLSTAQTVSEQLPPLTWAEVDADDPVDPNDQIWKIAEYSDLSSDDDIDDVLPGNPPQNAANRFDEPYGCSQSNLETMENHANLEALDDLLADQFWRSLSSEPFELSELQVIREILFMLQGLPTTLFRTIDGRFEPDERARLCNTSQEIFRDISREFSDIAICLARIRNFAAKAPSDHCLRTFRSGLESILQNIDGHLSLLEQRILRTDTGAPATILQLSTQITEIVEATGTLADLIQAIESKYTDTVFVLESIFDHVCQSQASCNQAGFQCLLNLFVQCFDTYFRSLQDWMEQGLVGGNHQTFVIWSPKPEKSLSGLWQNWYRIESQYAANRCPHFLQPLRVEIFNIGKTIVFLRHLGDSRETATASTTSTDFAQNKLTQSTLDILLPFSEVFRTSMREIVHRRLRLVTSTLREYLGNSCGLWKSLDALQQIYLGKNGSLVDTIDLKIFAAVDRCEKTWKDRFVLSDLLRATLEPIESIDVTQLSIESTSGPCRNMAPGRKSVRLLSEVQIYYLLHWSVANVITRTSLATYRRTSTFLMQIRRARYMLESRSGSSRNSLLWLKNSRTGKGDKQRETRNIGCLLRHNMLVVINDLYDHLTGLVIEQSNARLRRDLINAVDIDAMIAAHDQYCKRLERDACLTLTNNNTKPVHDHIISILDLCIQLSDLLKHNATNVIIPRHRLSATHAHSQRSSTANRQPRRRRHQKPEDDSSSSSSSSSSSDSNDEEENDPDQGNPPNTNEKPPLQEQLSGIRSDLDRHLSFVIESLLGNGQIQEAQQQQQQRPDDQSSRHWEILGRRLKVNVRKK